MKNQMTRECLYHSIKMEDELYHHGVLGMSWGDRNGPPYPLSGSAKKIARAEAKKKIEQERRLEKMRKIAAKKRKMQLKAAKKQERIDKKKRKLMDKGDMDAIYKNRKLFTNEEFQYAIERNRLLTGAAQSRDPRKAPNPDALNNAVNIAEKVGKIALAVVPVVTVTKGLAELSRMNQDVKIKDINEMNKAYKERIDTLMKFNPEAAMEFYNKVNKTSYGVNYESLAKLKEATSGKSNKDNKQADNNKNKNKNKNSDHINRIRRIGNYRGHI